MTHPAVVVRRHAQISPPIIGLTSSAISSERLISAAWHVFVDRNQMVLRRLGYGIIMFMEWRWHEIWGRYIERLLRGVLGQTGVTQLQQQ